MSESFREPFVVEVTEISPGTYRVVVVGEMDIAASPELTSQLSMIPTSAPSTVLVDLSQLTFIDSTGIKALISSAMEIESHGGKLVVVAPTPQIQRVFDIVRLADLVSIAPSVKDALRVASETAS